MKKKLTTFVLVFSIALLSVSSVVPQEPQQPSEDQKIEALKKKQAELKRQIREELERQNKALEDELNALQQRNSTNSTASPSGSPVRDVVNTTAPVNGSSTAGSDSATTSSSTMTAPAGAAANTAPVSAPPLGIGAATTASSQAKTNCSLVFMEPNRYSRAEQAICFLSRSIVARKIAGVPPNGIDPNREDQAFFLPLLLAQIIKLTPNVQVDAAIKSFVLDVEASRTDKQLGADPKTSGTTSLAVKGGVPTVLSWAVENGAAVASSSGTSYTFRVNPVGLAEGLSNQGYISGFRANEEDPLAGFLRKTSVGFTFDTTRGTNPPTLIGSKQQLSAVSFRYQIVNQRDPRASQYQKKWDQFFATQGLAFTQRQTDQLAKLQLSNVEGGFRSPALQQWLVQSNLALNGTTITATALNQPAAIEEVRNIIDQRLASLPATELEQDPEFNNALTDFVGAYLPYLAEKKKIMDDVSKGTLVTVEYTNFREPTAPDLSNFRFIAERGTVGGIDFTANASLTFFNKRPVGLNVQRLRDFDFSAQLDKKLGDVMGLGPSTLSFTGKFQRLTSNAVAFDGTVLPNTKGDIAAGQLKLIIPIKDSGIKIPFSITFSNRTELVREKEVRGNFGFTFDLDTLFAKFKPFAPN